jgi:hypothetical protein
VVVQTFTTSKSAKGRTIDQGSTKFKKSDDFFVFFWKNIPPKPQVTCWKFWVILDVYERKYTFSSKTQMTLLKTHAESHLTYDCT